ncbi:hypothetical protein D6745_03535 [Candidatus Woesearchaeota archaeon]|nr:MAG: hypothetical protein D6745_03535 [Candidatus Woesearchaeota archaeon]
MRFRDFLRGITSYSLETALGSILDTVRSGQPELKPGEIIADLHAHPYIYSENDLIDTLNAAKTNNVGILAVTCHATSKKQHDLSGVKRLFQNSTGYLCLLNRHDYGLSLSVDAIGKKITLVGAYETSVRLDGVSGGLDVLALMPDEGFSDHAKSGMPLDEYLDVARKHNAIIIGAHPFTIHDPYGPFGFFRFRLAKPEERVAIREKLFPEVESVDLVSDNAAWMVISDELVQQEYPGKPLANSDAHGIDSRTRREIGRSGNIFSLDKEPVGEELRNELRQAIVSGNFRTYHNHTPARQFLKSMVTYQFLRGE